MTVRVRSVPPFGVWCNVSIRVLGTRGDSSTLSSPTKFLATKSTKTQSYRGVTHPCRTVTAWERGVQRGTAASRPDHTRGPRSRHRSSKPNLRAGRKARGSTPPRAPKKHQRLCSSTGESKRLISARLVVQLHPQPPNWPQKSTRSTKCVRNFFVLFVLLRG